MDRVLDHRCMQTVAIFIKTTLLTIAHNTCNSKKRWTVVVTDALALQCNYYSVTT